MMKISDLLNQENFILKRAASTNGGEYCSSCPFCGGSDRFRIWPNEGRTGRYWCRQCGRSGDAIQFLKDYKGMSYKQACEYLNIEMMPLNETRIQTASQKAGWIPKAAKTPLEGSWQKRARIFVEKCQLELWKNDAALGYLRGRGLSDETIKMAQLGWNPADRYSQRDWWDLPEKEYNPGYTTNRLWLPKGWVIPYWIEEKFIRIRIRRAEISEKEDRYVLVSGSRVHPFMIRCEFKNNIMLVESELDCLLLHQEAGDLISVAATGSAQIRPDLKTHELLIQAGNLLISLVSCHISNVG